MLHLSTDRLAALGDEPPTSAEAAHLATCAACARERAAYQTLVAMAQGERSSLGLPLTRWDAISAALASEGSVRMAPATPVTPLRRAPRWPMQAAAGLLLLAGGAMLGRTSAGAAPLPGTAGSRPATTAAAPASAAATVVAAPADTTFASLDEARAAQQRSEQLFQAAAAYLAQHDSTSSGDGSAIAYRSRLAALDQVISTTRQAMREAPHDPVINGYYLTTIGQREATLRQLNTSLPSSLRLNSF